ncbi:MAG: hypothetical protein ABIR92_01740 [Gemmatimonadaceae bacterium]
MVPSARPLKGAVTLLCVAASLATAQDPSRDYLTISTTHFRVSFTRPLEGVARRVAANAERAYTQLSAEMHPPRGTIDVLVTDDFDFSNGSAITYPTNRIIVYAMPPVNDFGLRYTTDWAQMVVTHELAHIFHLDRTRGIWKLGQYVFGRSPFLFPNLYQPSWLIEGLAVYEESKLSGQGRIEGPEHHLLARAAAADHAFPRIGDLSLALPTFPGGNSAYAFGSLFFDYLARTRGDTSVGRFVESSSAQWIPYLIDIPARRAFGTGFGAAYSEWRKTIEQSVADSVSPPAPAWNDLTAGQLAANYPRWLDDSTLTFTGTSGKEVLSAHTVTTSGVTRNIGRRDGLSPTVRLPDGTLLFSQFEYMGPYTYRSDLYVQRGGGSAKRVTKGERLFTPDARADGAIIATQVVEGATRIVRVSGEGAVSPVTRADADTLWSEPRWSPAGDRIVSSRSVRGGLSQIVIVDTLGNGITVVASGRYLLASPSWVGNDAVIYTAGTRETNDVYVRELPSGRVSRLTDATVALFEPAERARKLAGFTLRADGYRLGVTDSFRAWQDTSRNTTAVDPRLPALAVDSSPPKKYSALRQLIPRYWVPVAEAGVEDNFRLGGYTEAWDILRRHYLYGEVRIPNDNSGLVAVFQHQYKGFGLPIVTTSVSQDWTRSPVVSRSSPSVRVGWIDRRIRDADVLSTYVRQRVRSSLTLSLGAGFERREYFGDPEPLLAQVDTGGIFRRADFPRMTLSSTYARYQQPAFAISPEDGFAVGVTARERFKSGFNASSGPSTSVVGTLSTFKSLDLPGYAHHVLAARVAGGWADTKTNANFEVGGLSGGTYQVFPGYTLGEGRRTFPVRGFPTATVFGVRALSASAEYRAPLSLTRRSLSILPVFLQRSALTLFGDYGVAWCPSTLATRQVCTTPSQEVKADMASVGGELSANVGLLSWDSPTRLRLGFALPVHNGAALGGSNRVYFTTGVSF